MRAMFHCDVSTPRHPELRGTRGVSLLRYFFALLAVAVCVPMVWAQCTHVWKPMDGRAGVADDVEAIVEWDPDGPGPQSVVIVVAGAFPQAGSHEARNVAMFDPSTHTWSVLGRLGTLTDRVNELLIDSTGGLVAAGTFTESSGVPTLRVARWTGTMWTPMGEGFNGAVYAMKKLPNGDIIAGGSFTQSGSTQLNRIARWNGIEWQPLGTGVSGTPSPAVHSLAVGGDHDIVAGGSFTSAGGVATVNLARWTGQSWTSVAPIHSIANSAVNNLQYLPNGHLIVAGNVSVTNATGSTTTRIARWDGASWWSLGSGVNNNIHSLNLLPDGALLVTGAFTTAGGLALPNIAQWNGASWSAFGTGIVLGVNSTTFCSHDGDVYLGTGYGCLRWSGSAWVEPGQGFARSVDVLTATADGGVVASGRYLSANTTADGIAKWDGSSWQPIGTGFSGYVTAIAEAPNGDVLAAGEIQLNGGTLARRVVRWNGSSWGSLGGSMNDTIYSIAVAPTGDILIGGHFTMVGATDISHVARWNGTAWTPVGSTQAEPADSLVITSNGDIYIATYEDAIGIFRCRNGGEWVRVDDALRPDVGQWRAQQLLALPNGRLAASVQYSNLGTGFDRIAILDNSGWVLSDTLVRTPNLGGVDAIGATPDSQVVAAGHFSSIGSAPIHGLAVWNGSTWKQLPPSINGYVESIACLTFGSIAIGGSMNVLSHGHISSDFALLECRCAADLDNDGIFDNGGNPDESVTIDDLLFFLTAFERGFLVADIDDGSGNGFYDEAVTIDDLLFFLVKFEAGC